MLSEINQNKFIEHAEFAGNLYGTSHKAVSELLTKNTIPILDLDEQGVRNIKKQSSFDAVFVFIEPPSIQDLEKRLIGRGTETNESLMKRMEAAKSSLDYAMEGVYDVRIVNDDFDKAYLRFEKFLRGQFDL